MRKLVEVGRVYEGLEMCVCGLDWLELSGVEWS